MWAPSQQISSTYAGSVGILSGTSMAAPHVAGLASRLLEGDPYILNSSILEWTLRYDLVTVGGSGLSIPQFSPGTITARPTVEMRYFGQYLSASLDPINLTASVSENAGIRMQAFGAATTNGCYVNGYRNSTLYLSQYVATTYEIPTLTAGSYYWTFTCTSPQSTQTTMDASAVIVP